MLSHRNQLAGLGIRLWFQFPFIRVNPVTRRQTVTPPRQGRHPTSWYRQAIKRSFARCGNNPPHSAGSASVLAAPAGSRCTCTRFAKHVTAAATTQLVHRRGSGLVADLYLAQLDRVVELLAHELEHIVERLEGIDVSADDTSRSATRLEHGRWEVRDEASDPFGSDRRFRSGDGAEVISAAEAKAYLIRANALAATLTLGVRLAAAPETCGIQVIPLHDPNSTLQLAPIGISADGRFLAFASYAPLLRGDTNGRSDIYVFDMSTSQLTMESALPDGSPANADSLGPDITDDGRFLAFHSSGQLIPGSGNDPTQQIVLRDRQLDTTVVLSTNDAGERGNDNSSGAVISGDGRVVAFQSYATNLVPDVDGNGAASDVYAVTVATRAIARVSTTSTGRQQAKGASFGPSISGDGQLIAFTSSAWLDEEQQQPARRTRRALPLHRTENCGMCSFAISPVVRHSASAGRVAAMPTVRVTSRR